MRYVTAVTGILLLISIAVVVGSMAVASDVRSAFSTPVLQMLHVSLILLASFGCFVTLVYLTNKNMERHGGSLALLALDKKRGLDNSLQRCDLSQKDAIALEATYQRCITGLQDTISCLEQLDIVFPARLFGFIIERQHVVWVASTTALYLLILTNFVYNGKLVLSF